MKDYVERMGDAIDKLTNEKYELQAEVKRLREENADLKSELEDYSR